jgi:hypothetical protein
MKDMHSAITAVAAIGPITLSADNTPAAIDLQGYNAAEILIGVGIGGITFDDTNKVEFKVTHSDDGTNYDAVEQQHINGATVTTGGIVKSLIAAHAAAGVSRVGYVGNRRYLKILADFSGTHGAGTPINVIVLKGEGYNQPEADQ